mgnify:FL=1
MNNNQRFKALRQFGCVECGRRPVDIAHSNFSKHGKGKGIKADDSYTVALCRVCHSDFDLFVNLNREQAKTKFADWLVKTNMALGCKDESAF